MWGMRWVGGGGLNSPHVWTYMLRTVVWGKWATKRKCTYVYIWLNFMVILLFYTFLFSSCRNRILSSFCSSTQYVLYIRFTNVYSIDVILHKLWLIFKLFFFLRFTTPLSPVRPFFHSFVVVTIAVLRSYTQTKWVKWKMENGKWKTIISMKCEWKCKTEMKENTIQKRVTSWTRCFPFRLAVSSVPTSQSIRSAHSPQPSSH